MKELSIEERAKAYDEVIKRLEDIRTGKCQKAFVFTEGLFDYLFPELEECNEEEVRKAMIDFFKHEREEGVVVSHYGVNIERMIAWLEQQKTSEEAIQYLKENHSPSEVSDFQTAMNIAIAKAYDKGVKDGLENRGQTFTKKEVDDAYLAGIRDAKKELEKQGEQATAKKFSTSEVIDIVRQAVRGCESFSDIVAADKYAAEAIATVEDFFKKQSEQESAWSEEDEKKELKKTAQRMISAEAKEAMYGKPTAWSEEDKVMLDKVIKRLRKHSVIDEEYLDIYYWLKSLKQRIGG